MIVIVHIFIQLRDDTQWEHKLMEKYEYVLYHKFL